MFYHYNQNNSGGTFVEDNKTGITHHVIIEATEPLHANALAELLGLYFNGCERGMDCNCCGDRWTPAYEGDAYPSIYGTEIKKGDTYDWLQWTDHIAFIHCLNGAVLSVKTDKNDRFVIRTVRRKKRKV